LSWRDLVDQLEPTQETENLYSIALKLKNIKSLLKHADTMDKPWERFPRRIGELIKSALQVDCKENLTQILLTFLMICKTTGGFSTKQALLLYSQ
jgi:hypothetical protein